MGTSNLSLSEMKRKQLETPLNQTYGYKESRSQHPISSMFMTSDANEDTQQLDPSRYSSWLNLKRIQAWVNRFIENCQKPKITWTYGQLEADKQKRAEVQLIQQTQRIYFRNEWRPLSCGRPLPRGNRNAMIRN